MSRWFSGVLFRRDELVADFDPLVAAALAELLQFVEVPGDAVDFTQYRIAHVGMPQGVQFLLGCFGKRVLPFQFAFQFRQAVWIVDLDDFAVQVKQRQGGFCRGGTTVGCQLAPQLAIADGEIQPQVNGFISGCVSGSVGGSSIRGPIGGAGGGFTGGSIGVSIGGSTSVCVGGFPLELAVVVELRVLKRMA